MRHFHSDFSQTDDAERFPTQFCALQRFLVPLASVHACIGLAEESGHGQHDGKRLLGDGNSISAGRVHYGDAFAGGGIQINVVNAHSGAANDAQLGRVFQQCRVHLHGGTDNEGVGGLQRLRQVAV